MKDCNEYDPFSKFAEKDYFLIKKFAVKSERRI